MNIAEVAIRKKTVTLVFTVMLVIGGIISFNGIGRLEDPEFTIKDALVITAYPGASAQEVEEEVTDLLETAVQQLGQLKELESISKPGLSKITVTIKDKYTTTKLPQVWDELRRKVGDVQAQLPPGAHTSIVNDDFGDVFGILLGVSGEGYSFKELEVPPTIFSRSFFWFQMFQKSSSGAFTKRPFLSKYPPHAWPDWD